MVDWEDFEKKRKKYCYMTCFEKIIGKKLSIFLKYDPQFVYAYERI